MQVRDRGRVPEGKNLKAEVAPPVRFGQFPHRQYYPGVRRTIQGFRARPRKPPEAIGRSVRWEEVSPEIARRGMLEAGWPPSVVDGVLKAHAGFAEEPEPFTPTVEEVTGAPARPFREWAADQAGDFRRAPPRRFG